MSFFAAQVVLLTGCTGHLGACLLYKMVCTVPAKRVYLLIRGSQERAIEALTNLMPNHFPGIMDTGKVQFILGDMTQPGLGISDQDLKRLCEDTSVVIHAAANIGLRVPLREAVRDNCLPSLQLASMATTFKNLRHFVYVSSLYALSFLPGGRVQEKHYALDDPEQILDNILSGRDRDTLSYAWPYARSKHLTENLLLVRFQSLPLMIIRPGSIGPALFEPFELYGKKVSMPISQFCERLMYPTSVPNIFHVALNSDSGTNVLDEIPVDLLANVLLQHIARGTSGPVHANAAFFFPRTFDDFVEDVNRWVPEPWRSKMAKIEFSTDHSSQECQLARFYRILTRRWEFLNDRQLLLAKQGPIGVSLQGHDHVVFRKKRIEEIFCNVLPVLERMIGKGDSRL